MTEEKRERRKPASHAEEDKKALGRALAAARRDSGYSMDAAANAIGLANKQAIDNFEKGRNVIDALRLKQLAGFYGTTVDRLCGAETARRAGWPFSRELQEVVATLEPKELGFLEKAMWAHLKMDAPPILHMEDDRDQRSNHKYREPGTLRELETTSRQRPRISHKQSG